MNDGRSLRVRYVSPTYFSADSFVGGGERYAEELARAMSARADVRLVTFGTHAHRERLGPTLERVILKSWTRDKLTPFSPNLFAELRDADVIHCFQYFGLSTFLAALYGHLRGKKVFVSDLGGGGWTPGYHFDQSRWITAHLPISEYAARDLPGRKKTLRVISGGVDTERYAMRPTATHDGSVVFLGRVLPHKGLHHLIAAVPPQTRVHIIGTEQDEAYRVMLEKQAAGKDVHFLSGLSDESVIAHLQRAMALVHLIPSDDRERGRANELFGLALVEAMACGCPPIASRAASLPEVLGDELSCLLVRPDDVQAIRATLERLTEDPDFWNGLSRASRSRVERTFTWQAVGQRCLEAYVGNLGLSG